MGMISSLDGAATLDGSSTALGGPPDRAVFRALRATADVILVGASTVRSENYGAVRLPEELVTWRRDHGLTDTPRVAIVSTRLGFDLSESLADARPFILTSSAAPSDRLDDLRSHAEIIVAGREEVDLASAMSELRRGGVDRVTLEGGPTLNGQMVGLLDEVSITLSPVIVGGPGPRVIGGREEPHHLSLVRAIHCGGFLLLRYLVR
jgi:riboflavin biosynthesis pyrimidine reductase